MKLRMIHFEVEGDQKDCADIVRAGVQAIFDGQHSEPIPPATLDPALPKRIIAPRKAHKTAISNDAVEHAHPLGEKQQAVLNALKKKPMSAQELLSQLKWPPAHVYQTAHELKKRGLIENRPDDAGDGQRRYFIAEAK